MLELSTAQSRLASAARTHAARALTWAPGLLATFAAALLSSLAAGFLHAPAMLIALVFGMALNPVFAARPQLAPGVMLSARTILRLGIVLLGARVTTGELASLGAPTLLLAVGGVAATIAGGWAIDLFLGRQTRPHHDLDIQILRRDQAALRGLLADWDLHLAGDGRLQPWPADT